MKEVRIVLGVGLMLLVLTAGCKKTLETVAQYDRPLPPGQLALRKITDPRDIPDFVPACYNRVNLVAAINESLNYFSRPSSKKYFPYGQITHGQAVASLQAFAALIQTEKDPDKLNRLIREKFDVYISVGCDDKGTVLFTGYYTPIFNGSMEKTERFNRPLYKQPADLVKGEDGVILGRRGADGSMNKYPARAEIESSGMMAGKELIWLEDPFEVYVAHVQGSAKVRLPDGKLITIGYAANNGHEYKSVARALVKDDKIAADKVSLSAMIDFFRQNPGQIGPYTNKNPRFVFFRFEEGNPRGSLNVPVTRMRSIATDKSIYPRGCLAFAKTELPRVRGGGVMKRPFSGFLLDQDTGGAIRAPGRCDVYMGQGDRAGQLAGHTYQEGRLYYLFLKGSGGVPMPMKGSR